MGEEIEEAPLEDADAAPLDEVETPEENKKEVLQEQIETLKQDVSALEEEVNEGEELDFSAIFNEEDMEDKGDNLANEDEDFDMEASGEGFFSPSSASELESALDTEGMEFSDASDFFSHNANVESMDSLFAPEKKAAKDDVIAHGEMGDEIVSKGQSKVPDGESDHEDNILFEILGDIKEVAYEDGEYKRTVEPKFEKAASKKAVSAPAPANQKRPIRSLGNVKTAAPATKEVSALASLVFPDDELFG